MNFKKLEEVNKEIDIKTKELIKIIKQYSPYNIICYIFIYIRNMQCLDNDDNQILEHDKLETQFCIEFLYGLITCINKKEFKNNFFKENVIYEIINICKELFKLKEQAISSMMIYNDIDSINSEYIFNDLIRLDITGKRYDYFEKVHHKNTLKVIFKYVKEKYSIDEDLLLDGIENLKTSTIFGLNDAVEKMSKIFSDNTIEDENNLSDILKNEFQNIYNEIFELENFDVLKLTKWPPIFINIFSTGVGTESISIETFDFLKIIKILNIINSKPIINLKNKYYCIRLPRLLDNFDKILLKHIYKDFENDKQIIIKEFSKNIEDYTKNIFFEIFGDNAKYYSNNYYIINNSTIENDLLIQLDDYLFIIEIKAGNFTPDLAYENLDSHIDTLNNLVSKAGNQISKLEKELLKKGTLEIYDSNKKRAKIKAILNKEKYNNIFKIAVTFEGFNEITARAEKFEIINLNKNTIVCSIDDLEVYGDFFKNQSINFINYITYRTIATQNKLINLNDELDHLGLYLEHSNYSMYIDMISKKYKNIGMVGIFEYRTKIDNYYNGIYFKDSIEKPKLCYPTHINDIINYLNNHIVKHSEIIGNSLISCDSTQLEKFELYIIDMIQFFKIKNKFKYMATKTDNCLFIISCCINTLNNEKELILDCYANLKISDVNKAYATFIIYDENESILNIKTTCLTKSDYQYFNDLEIDKIAINLKRKRKNTKISKRKIGRNEQCPCGSGKKYKKCCGK